MTSRNAANRLEREFSSQMFISTDGIVLFSVPAKALKRTLFGDPDAYRLASVLMQLAETEQSLGQTEELSEAELRKAELNGRS